MPISSEERTTYHKFADRVWTWRGYAIGYCAAGLDQEPELPAIVLIHGFGASVGHWRKNIPVLAESNRVYAIDLIGFGSSAQPKPSELPYTFETWGRQVADFVMQVVGNRAILVGNSIGAVVAMQAAIYAPELINKTVLINCSLRLLQEQNQLNMPWFKRVGVKAVQNILGVRAIAKIFFDQVRNPRAIRQILSQAYIDKSAITDELVEILLRPALNANAVDVFMAFVRYSQGPRPEDLLAILPCDAIVLWGERDPWEPISIGKASFAEFACVKEFIALPNAGHCPQDEVPALVNPILVRIASSDLAGA
ncbi:alpha/beta fold hydrolase [Pseudanabaena mucicola]|uniref:Alpha/beta fold hydrolase n=1 Tax=Pseudanabaena mucicola FACHB-723 TaxID=2692860 RepID=A0ABR7ZW50_9CYAN|nr:alpha/beta fold hydrolase [Pseudanabaena mucicola]MBD2188198.1 alpha/beta fold hydrolase [Pseudanabaena mucicola FACHB-723]